MWLLVDVVVGAGVCYRVLLSCVAVVCNCCLVVLLLLCVGVVVGNGVSRRVEVVYG